MKRIVLISCVSKKLDHRAKAKDIYISTLFRYAYRYAQSMHPDKIFILSAKYGLLDPENEIEPYNQTLNKMTSTQVKAWSETVLARLAKESDLEKDEIIFLAGDRYRKYLIPSIKKFRIPLQGPGIGRQLKYLKEHTR
jgi:cytoplasmic iron level regulating protein YaaA (DUF328/UPF0246 family)